MPQFSIETARIYDAASQLRSAMDKLTDIKSGVSSVARNLDGDTRLMANIKTKVNRASNDITKIIFSVNSLCFGLENAAEIYDSAESRIKDNAGGTSKAIHRDSPVPGQDFLPHGSVVINDFVIDGRKPEPYVNPFADIAKKFKSLLDCIEKYGGSEYVGPFASTIGVLASFMNLIDPNASNSPKSWLSNAFNFGEDGLNLMGGISKWFGDTRKAFGFGTAGSIAGIAGNITDLHGMSDSDKLKNSGDLLTDIARLTDDLSSHGVDLSKTDAANKNVFIAALTSLASMAAFACGDVYQRATDDGVYDLNDYSDTLLGTGINGADTLLSAVTFGLIDINAESAVKTFEDNTNSVTQMIKDTGAPTWAQVAMTVPAAAGVVIVSTAQVFIDYGKSIGNGIKSFINIFKQ